MGVFDIVPSLQVHKELQFTDVSIGLDIVTNAGNIRFIDHKDEIDNGGTLAVSVQNGRGYDWRHLVNKVVTDSNNIVITNDANDPGKITITNKVETFVAAITENDLDINGVTYIGPLGNTDIDTANDCILVQVYTGPSASESGSIVNVKVTKDEHNASYYKYLDIDFGSVAQFRNLNSSTVYAYITIIHGAQSVQCTSTHSGQPT